MTHYNWVNPAIVCFVTLGLSACIRPPVRTGGFDVYGAKKVDLQTNVGEQQSVEVGEAVYQIGNGEEVTIERATLKSPAEGHLEVIRSVSLPAGYSGRLITRDSDGAKVLCPKLTESQDGGATYQPYDECLVDTNRDGIFDSAMFPAYEKYFPLDKTAAYTVTNEKAIHAGVNGTAFKREIIYQGYSGTTLRFSYREYSNDMARPAFTQELTYDHKNGEPTIVGFKGLRMKVVDANNTKVTYVIDQGMSGK